MARNYSLTWTPPTAPPQRHFIAIGNSTSYPSTGNWPAEFIAARVAAGRSDTLYNSAQPGTRTQQFIDDMSGVTGHLSTTKQNTVLFFEGAQQIDDNYGNFIDGGSAPPGHGWSDSTAGANGWAKTKEFIDLCHAIAVSGNSSYPTVKVWVLTLLYWNDGEQHVAGLHAAFDAYNTNARAQASYCEHLIDIAAVSPAFDPDNDSTPPATRPWYVGEGPHPLDAGKIQAVHNTAHGITEIAARVTSLASSF